MPRWLDSTVLMLRWQYLRFRSFLPTLIVIQLMLAVGVIYGLAFLIPDINRETALYLATGAPTLSLILLGLNVVPSEVAQGKVSGRYTYLASLPIPRLAPLVAEVTFWLLVQLPGTALALLVAVLRFDVDLRVGWSVVPAMALVALTGAAVGYALAAGLPPQVTSQVMAFMGLVILLFSPINFPADRMPGFLQAVHAVLPVQHMADVIRGSLTGRWATSPAVAFAVVGVWCAAGLGVSYRAAVRRP